MDSSCPTDLTFKLRRGPAKILELIKLGITYFGVVVGRGHTKVTGATVFKSIFTVLVKDASQLAVTKDFISLGGNQC